MKGRIYTLLSFLLLTLSAVAQDFKLYYAKNVTDVTEFLNLEEMSKQLNWHQVANGSVDGNRADVEQVKAMLSETRMKGLDDQRLFWKMRDEMLLCFRIDDPTANGSFRVEVIYGQDADGKDIKKTLTTRRYFFANMPLDCDMVTINVYRVKDPTQRINFRYSVFDWDDDNVYIFQLDQKRQSTGDTYKMEYVTSYMDNEGEIHSQSNILELKETKFQSFYVPEGQSLTDVYFLTGNDTEGDVKLRMDMDEIHPNIDIDHQLEVPSLTSTFKLAKHENREMMNFNWVGTGLFEKYDTLYIKLFDNKGKPVANASMKVRRVDENGNPVSDETLKFIGYDSRNKQYKVLTYGHPAYVEILAGGFLPLVYRYKGAADKTSRIVSADLCSAKITLKSGGFAPGSIAVSDLYFRYMKDESITITRKEDNTDYALMTLDEQNISGKASSNVVSFMDNGGNNYKKLLNNKPTEKFAQLEVAFSAPTSPNNQYPTPTLTAKEEKSGATHDATATETSIIKAGKFGFTRDYYFVRYNMADALPRNKECSVTLKTSTASYNNFPKFLNKYIDDEKEKKDAEKKAREMSSPKDGRENTADMMTGADVGIKLPVDIKFSAGGFTIQSGATLDFLKQTFNIYINGYYTSNFWEGGEQEQERLKSVRDNAKEVQNWRYKEHTWGSEATHDKKDLNWSMANPSFEYDDWIIQELEDVFKVQSKHVGWYFQGGLKVAFKSPLWGYVLPDVTQFQLSEFTLWAQIGRGFFFSPDMGAGKMKVIRDAIHDYTGLELDLGAQIDINARVEGGIKSYGKKNEYEWSSEDKGGYLNFSATGLASAWLNVKTERLPVINVDAGLRAGLKLQFITGLVWPFSDHEWCGGLRAMALGGVQAHLDVTSFIYDLSWRWGFHAGVHGLYPNANTNPFHKKFPYWLPDKDKKSLVGERFRTLQAPEPNSLGRTLVNNIYYNANPHFLDDKHVVFNDLGKASDYNDDHIAMTTVTDEATSQDDAEGHTFEPLSVTGTSAGQHARSKRGDKEVVVYQQTSLAIDNAAVNEKTAPAMDASMQEHTQIKAAIRQSDGTWKQTVVTPDDGFIDKNPKVSVQEDGKAAVIYLHGKKKVIDESQSADSVMNQMFDGQLQLRTYDPAKGWSEPTPLYDPDTFGPTSKYDLILRNDTVLVGAMLDNPDFPPLTTAAGKYFRYTWKPINSDEENYTWEDLNVIDFSMSRVGKHGVIAMLYEQPDSTREIYVKTVSMDGCYSGMAGSDLGIGRSMPNRVKIVSDREDNNTNDFAVLWTEASTTIRDAENGNKALKDYATVINATRIRLTDAPQITYPLTVGSELDSLQLGDFDGYLDDASIKVVYTLTDKNTHASAIMYNEKEFTNSFESDVTYSREALLGSSTLPVNVDIINTGTSAIKAATVTINGDEIAIPNAVVQPMQRERFVVQYPIPDNFDGYIQSSVEVEYANVFKVSQQTGRRAAPRNLLRQRRAFPRNRVAAGNIDCNVINHSVENGVNTFVVEIIDRSSRGLTPGTAVQVGAYVHPSAMETVSSKASTLVYAEDFARMGAVRKAYAEVVVSGITEPVNGYIAAHIIDLDVSEDADEEDKRITNACPTSGPSFVVFHPTGEATYIDIPISERTKTHRISITSQEGGVLLGNLESGEDIRLFNAEGWTVYMDRATSNTHFVPLKRHGVYLLSAGKEVFKFTY